MTIQNKPLVSVLTTVYNRQDFVASAIQSVLDSTYENWELIIVDDRSTDDSLSIIKAFEAKDSRIKVYVNDTNLGDYPNRNKAASYAKGKYLKYLDADDMIFNHGLEILVHFMEQFPNAGYGLCSLPQDDHKIYPYTLSPKETYENHYLKQRSIFHKAPLSSIILRSVFEKEKGFANVRHFGDYELWHRLSKKYPVVLMPGGIVWYRESDGQEASIRKKNPLNGIKTVEAALNHLTSDDCPLDNMQKKTAIKVCKKTMALMIVSAFKRHGIKKGLELKKYSNLGYLEILKLKFLKN